MLDEYLNALNAEDKEKTASQARFGAASVGELAKLAGISLNESTCGSCGSQMEKTASVWRCSCGMMKKAKDRGGKGEIAGSIIGGLGAGALTADQIGRLASKGFFKSRTRAGLAGGLAGGLAALSGGTIGGLLGRKIDKDSSKEKSASVMLTKEASDKLIELVALCDYDFDKTAAVLEAQGMDKEAVMGALRALGQTAKGALQVGKDQGLKSGLQAAGRGLKWTGHEAMQAAKGYGRQVGSAYRAGTRGGKVGPVAPGAGGVWRGAKNVAREHPGLTLGAGVGAGYGAAKLSSDQGFFDIADAAGRLMAKSAHIEKEAIVGPLIDVRNLGLPSLAGYIVGKNEGRELSRSGKKYDKPSIGLGALVPGYIGYRFGKRSGYDEASEDNAKEAQASGMGTPIPLDEIRESIQEAQSREDIPGRARRWQIGGGVGGGLSGGAAGYGAGRFLGPRASLIGAGLGAAGGAFGGQYAGKEYGAEEARADKAVAMLRALRAHQRGALSGYGAGMQRGYSMGRGPMSQGPEVEKTAFSVTEEGHEYDAAMARLRAAHEAKTMALAQKHEGMGSAEAPGSYWKALRGFSPEYGIDPRHEEYVARQHEAGKNAWNPLGGILTPSSQEEGGTRWMYGKFKQPESEEKTSSLRKILNRFE